MTHCLTSQEALRRFDRLTQRELADLVQESHKDHYGVRGRWAYSADHEELVRWWAGHYTWCEYTQVWHGNWVEEEDFPCYEDQLMSSVPQMSAEDFLAESLAMHHDPLYVIKRPVLH
jgi:hypothetical protein